MSFSTTDSFKEYTSSAGQTIFPFTGIAYLEGTVDDVFSVYDEGVLVAPANYTLAEGVATDGVVTTGTLTFTVGRDLNDTIKIERNVVVDQDSDFTGTSFPAQSVENTFDNIVMMIQDAIRALSDKLKLAAGSSASSALPLEEKNKYIKWKSDKTGFENAEAIPTWAATTDFVSGNIVIYNNAIYQCNTTHTSTSDFNDDTAKWTAITGPAGSTGPTGPKGSKGDTGATGATGAAGANGAPGVNGIFSAIASEAEAEAGVDNTKGMTPLRTRDAIDTVHGTASQAITDALDTRLTAAESSLINVASRLTAVEGSFNITHSQGQQRINNNQSTWQRLTAAAAQLGRGNSCELDSDGAHSAELVFELKRKDNAEFRFARVYAELHYINGSWTFGVRDEVVLTGELSGITFRVVQVNEIAHIEYQSDNMAGGGYDTDNSLITWTIRETVKAPA